MTTQKPPTSRAETTRRSNSLVRACLDLLTYRGCLAVRVNNQPIAQRVGNVLVGYRKLDRYQPRGLPDIWAIAPGGRIVLVECKSGSGRMSKDQLTFFAMANEKGALCLCIHSVGELDRVCKLAADVGWSNAWIPQDDAKEER